VLSCPVGYTETSKESHDGIGLDYRLLVTIILILLIRNELGSIKNRGCAGENWRKGGGGNLNPNARGLTEQVRGCPQHLTVRQGALP
jgi:hypothetical protein